MTSMMVMLEFRSSSFRLSANHAISLSDFFSTVFCQLRFLSFSPLLALLSLLLLLFFFFFCDGWLQPLQQSTDVYSDGLVLAVYARFEHRGKP